MSDAASLKAAIQRLIQWSKVKPAFPESAVEAVIVSDLLCSALGFDARSVERQYKIRSTGCEPDIILFPKSKDSIVIEVKRFHYFDSNANVTRTLKDAGAYVRDMKQEFGIITDGLTWIYFKVQRYGNYHRIYRLLMFNIETNSVLATASLKRTQKGKVRRFFEVLEAVQMPKNLATSIGKRAPLSLRDLNNLMGEGNEKRITTLTQRTRKEGVTVKEVDEIVLRAMYYNDAPVRIVKPIIEPLELLKATPKKSTKSKPKRKK